jgi:selenocysteine-specific elongation factor
VILGTAGHVDHGKTALVKALTGVDTDRLAEEKRRGITIDLGFAPLHLDDGTTLGVVDVPGHEAFVRNMLAGATGVDLALLVVAADEGVMPQTQEHLAILDLLGVRGGVVAITKGDLVDPEWLELVREDVRATLVRTALAGAPIVTTSVVTGEGLDRLRAAIAAAARALPAREARDLFRLPVDRAFTVRGTGTVVTGTVWSGRLERDTVVRLLPGGRTARVRGIESHGISRSEALPGTRAAIALAGVEVSEVRRGTVAVTDEGWTESRTILAEVALLETAPHPLGPRTGVRFHLGTTEVGARVVTAGGPLAPGQRKQARLVLDAPIVARAGDRFVLRSTSPLTTIGGGIINDPAPPHRRPKPWPHSVTTPEERLAYALASAGGHGVEIATLAVRLGAPPATIDQLLGALTGRARRVGGRLFAESVVSELAQRCVALVNEHHQRAPLEPGAPLQSIRARLAADAALTDHVLAELVRENRIEVDGALVMRRGWTPTLSPSEQAARERIRSALERGGREPPSVGELEATLGPSTLALLRLLEREGQAVQVEADRYYATGVIEEMLSVLREQMVPGQEYQPPDFRDMLGLTRKYLIPFLEYCDRRGYTERRATGRVLGRAWSGLT